jgi:hypothetical protein
VFAARVIDCMGETSVTRLGGRGDTAAARKNRPVRAAHSAQGVHMGDDREVRPAWASPPRLSPSPAWNEKRPGDHPVGRPSGPSQCVPRCGLPAYAEQVERAAVGQRHQLEPPAAAGVCTGEAPGVLAQRVLAPERRPIEVSLSAPREQLGVDAFVGTFGCSALSPGAERFDHGIGSSFTGGRDQRVDGAARCAVRRVVDGCSSRCTATLGRRIR